MCGAVPRRRRACVSIYLYRTAPAWVRPGRLPATSIARCGVRADCDVSGCGTSTGLEQSRQQRAALPASSGLHDLQDAAGLSVVKRTVGARQRAAATVDGEDDVQPLHDGASRPECDDPEEVVDAQGIRPVLQAEGSRDLAHEQPRHARKALQQHELQALMVEMAALQCLAVSDSPEAGIQTPVAVAKQVPGLELTLQPMLAAPRAHLRLATVFPGGNGRKHPRGGKASRRDLVV